MRDHGADRIYAKKLSPNDNSKNQIYLGGGFGALNIIPHGEIVTDTRELAGSKQDRPKASVIFYWLDEDGRHHAPNAQLILYPDYPEVRMSGFLKGCKAAPSDLLTVRDEGRILFFGITASGDVLGYATGPNDSITAEINARDWQAIGVFIELPTDPDSKVSSKEILLTELRRIYGLHWIVSQKLEKDGTKAPYAARNGGGYGCATFTNKGTCQNRLLVKHQTLEASVLNALQHYLMNQEALGIFCDEYTQHVNRMRMERNANIAGYEAQLVRFEKERKKLVEAILRGIPGDQLKDDFIDLGMRKKDVEARLAETEEAPVLLHPRMANHYSDTVTRLISSLDSEGLKAESQELLRTMIDKITLVPNAERTELQIDLHGDLAGILKIAENSTKSMTQMAHGALKVKMVGPAGLEPAT